jgi:hypothetical protein
MATNLLRFRSWARLWKRERSVDRRTEITTEITVEIDRLFVIRRRRPIRTWCPECGSEVELVGEAEAKALTGMSGRGLRDLAAAQGWHFSEGPDGTGLVCLDSLVKSK